MSYTPVAVSDDEADPEVTVVSVPDVSVVIAVYNTMPYLTGCLESVVGQSIGIDRLEIIAVDDGSTDGGGAELDAWAERFPGTITVLHQENSGGPAGPSNRALDIATGRYVFFLGADDYLGAEALERLVATADELDADIVLGRLVGTGGRGVSQVVYADGNRDDIDLVNSPLPWALSNTKLFRRSMLEEHRIRYPEELKSGSDQPFTIRAVVAARRIAVRADYEFYYAVRRTDASNITYRTSLDGFVRDTAIIMDVAADAITDPVARDRVLHRHFTWELGKLLGERFLAAGRDEQVRVQDGIRKLAEAYLSEGIRTGLDTHHRIRLSVAQHGSLDDLIAVSRHYAESGLRPVVQDGEHWYAALPGFRDAARGFPDSWFDVAVLMPEIAGSARVDDLRWGRAADGRRALVLALRAALPDLDRRPDAAPSVTVGDRAAHTRLSAAEPGGAPGTPVHAEIPIDDLVTQAMPKCALPVRFTCTILGETHTGPVTGPVTGATRVEAGRIVYRHGLRFLTISTRYDRRNKLVVFVNPVAPRRIVGRLVGILRRR
jgi:poly(ribitol-phosphate) beta-N-acetylglucosaminyltransferase